MPAPVNPNRSLLDVHQIFQRAFDESTDKIRVDASISLEPGMNEITITHVDDSIRIGDGSSLTTITTVGPKSGLDVNIIGGVVSGTFTPSGLTVEGKTTEVTLNSSTWTPLPASALANRNAITIQNRSGVEIKINFDNAVAGYIGIAMPDQFERFYDVTDDIIIYAKAASGTPTIVVEELA